MAPRLNMYEHLLRYCAYCTESFGGKGMVVGPFTDLLIVLWKHGWTGARGRRTDAHCSCTSYNCNDVEPMLVHC